MTAASAKPVQAPSLPWSRISGTLAAVDELVGQRGEPGLIDEVARVDPVRQGVELAADALGGGEQRSGSRRSSASGRVVFGKET